jgi:hypothetical protein
MNASAFWRRARREPSGAEQKMGRAFEKAVRSKPLARRTRATCKLNGAKERCGSWREERGRSGGGAREGEIAGIDDRRWCKRESGEGIGSRAGRTRRSAVNVQSFRVVGEPFHAAVVTNGGGERSWR